MTSFHDLRVIHLSRNDEGQTRYKQAAISLLEEKQEAFLRIRLPTIQRNRRNQGHWLCLKGT
jgi:hypothetical protein